MSDYLTFIHRFSPTVSCTVRIKDEPPISGQNLAYDFEWTGKPKRKHLAAYRQWILATNKLLCDRWKKTILYVLVTAPNQAEFWEFEPGQPPRLAQKLNVGIP